MVAANVISLLPCKHSTIPVLVQDLKAHCPARHLELGFVQLVKKFPQFFLVDQYYPLPLVAGVPTASPEANASWALAQLME